VGALALFCSWQATLNEMIFPTASLPTPPRVIIFFFTFPSFFFFFLQFPRTVLIPSLTPSHKNSIKVRLGGLFKKIICTFKLNYNFKVFEIIILTL
jgi:hypothetical protein